MLRKTPWLGLLAAWAGVSLAQGTTVQSPARSAPAGATAPAPAGPAATPASRPVLERLDIRAQLMPRRYTTIAAEIGAKIAALPVPEGGAFRAGQLLEIGRAHV